MGLLYKFFQLFLKFYLQCNSMMYMLLAIDQSLSVGDFLVVR